MNTQLLYSISTKTLEFINSTRLVKSLNAVIAALNNQISNPNPEHQSQISSAVAALRERLDSAPKNFFPKTWMPAIEELEFSDLIGGELVAKVEGALNKNQLTITNARDEIQAIVNRLNKLHEQFTATKANLESLGLVGEPLEPGSAELSIVIPREVFHNDFHGSGKNSK